MADPLMKSRKPFVLGRYVWRMHIYPMIYDCNSLLFRPTAQMPITIDSQQEYDQYILCHEK